MNDELIRKKMSEYKFYHIIKLTDDILTPGNPAYLPAQNVCMKHLKSLDLKGKRVLDIGCRDGLFSFSAESMGAAEVIGIDNDLSKPATEFLIPFFNSKVQMKHMNLYDLTSERFGFFDVVIFPGVLYHLRYPFWGLKVIRDVMKPGGHLIIETAIWEFERDKAILYCPIGEDSPYEPTSCSFFNEKGLIDTLASLGYKTNIVEHVGKRRKGLNGPVDRIKYFYRPFFRRENVATRCVFSSVFCGIEKASETVQYWDSTHHIHTKLGG